MERTKRNKAKTGLRDELKQELQMDAALFRKTVCVWGTGNTTALYQKCFQREGVDPVYYLDNNPAKRGICCGEAGGGKTVIHPLDLEQKEIRSRLEESIVLVCSANPEINRSILGQIRELGLLGMSADRYFFCRNQEKIMETFDSLEDEFSRETYGNVLLSRMRNEEIPEHICVPGQYFCLRPFLRRKEQEVYFDIGAWVGDTIEQYITVKNGVFHKIAAFEPDPANYRALEARTERIIREWGIQKDAILLCRAGIGRETVRGSMEHGGDRAALGARIKECSEDKEDSCMIYAMDDWAGEWQPSLIKADIESFEYDMLKGASETIRRNKPLLAVCIYHNAADLYDIPALVRQLLPSYRLAVRHHTYEYCDTVLYAYEE